MQMKETRTFKCSIEKLFSYITEPEKQKQWMKGLLSNEKTNEKQGAGSTFRMVVQEGTKQAVYQGEVTAFDKPERVEVVFWGGNFPGDMKMRVDYRLTDLVDQTKLDYTATVEATKIPFYLRWMMWLFKIFGRMQLRSFLNKLRTLVESPSPAELFER